MRRKFARHIAFMTIGFVFSDEAQLVPLPSMHRDDYMAAYAMAVGVETVLLAFTGGGLDRSTPVGSLLLDASSKLYGTTEFGGEDNSAPPPPAADNVAASPIGPGARSGTRQLT